MWKRLCLESCYMCLQNGKYLASDIDKIICHEIIDTEEPNFNEKI